MGQNLASFSFYGWETDSEVAVTCLQSASSVMAATGTPDSQIRTLLNPAKLPHTPTPSWEGCTGGHAFPLSQVLDLPHSPDVADALVRLPQPKRCTVIARDGISETPWEVLNDQSENRNQAPLETCTRATQSPFR